MSRPGPIKHKAVAFVQRGVSEVLVWASSSPKLNVYGVEASEPVL